jgi:hypothetical protein
MPGVFPRQGPRPTQSHAEKTLYRALVEHLPPTWTAWHSLKVRDGRQWEGEGDFVLAIPERGFLVLEVKGGAIEQRDGLWFQNSRQMERAPREQANRYARTLTRRLEEELGEYPPFAVATAFPDTPFRSPPTQGDLIDAVLGQQDLAALRERLEEIATHLFRGRPPPRDGKWIATLHALWGETWKPALGLGERTALREREIVALDAEQLAVLDAIDESRRMLVLGGPGTGKTLLARELIRRRRAAGKDALYLCWTRALAKAMRGEEIEQAFTVREYAADILRRTGIQPQEGAPIDQWTHETWELVGLQAACDGVPLLGFSYDVVVVDEAQDLTENEWDLVKAIAGNEDLWAFGDTGQGFWPDRRIPRDLFPAQFQLRKSYRCPEPVDQLATAYRHERPSEPDLDAPEVTVKASPELQVIETTDTVAAIEKELRKLLRNGVRPHQIAVLSLAGQARSEVTRLAKLEGIPVARADASDADERLVADTFLRFKGLERPWIIVTELSRGRESHGRYDVRMHIALSRATVGCIVVASEEEIAADPRLAGARRPDSKQV